MMQTAHQIQKALEKHGLKGISIMPVNRTLPRGNLFGKEPPKHASSRQGPIEKVRLHVPHVDPFGTRQDNREVQEVVNMETERDKPHTPEEKLRAFVEKHASNLQANVAQSLGIRIRTVQLNYHGLKPVGSTASVELV